MARFGRPIIALLDTPGACPRSMPGSAGRREAGYVVPASGRDRATPGNPFRHRRLSTGRRRA